MPVQVSVAPALSVAGSEVGVPPIEHDSAPSSGSLTLTPVAAALPLFAEETTGEAIAAGLTTGAMMLATVLVELVTPRLMADLGYRRVMELGIALLGRYPSLRRGLLMLIPSFAGFGVYVALRTILVPKNGLGAYVQDLGSLLEKLAGITDELRPALLQPLLPPGSAWASPSLEFLTILSAPRRVFVGPADAPGWLALLRTSTSTVRGGTRSWAGIRVGLPAAAPHRSRAQGGARHGWGGGDCAHTARPSHSRDGESAHRVHPADGSAHGVPDSRAGRVDVRVEGTRAVLDRARRIGRP